MRGKGQRVARPVQTHLQNSEVTGPKFTKFLSDIISGVNMRNCVAVLPSVVEGQQTEWRWGMPIFLPIQAKNQLP